MQNTIHIPEPCSEKWDNMKSVGNNQRHCDVCKHSVHDFSKSSLSEINEKTTLIDDEKTCGYYHERHTNNERSIYIISNRLDNAFSRTRLKRFVLLFISLMLLFAGCARRRAMGCKAYSMDGLKKSSRTHAEQASRQS